MSDQVYIKVVAAMKRACRDMVEFSGEPSKPLNSEYLFTVAVAKEISALNGFFGDPYRIYLEKSVKDFATDCLPAIKIINRGKGRHTLLRRNPAKVDGGRIDVAVYKDIPNSPCLGYQPLTAIEVKGFNPNRTLILKDLRRNLKYFTLSDDTGSSLLSSAIFASFHYWRRVGDTIKEDERLSSLKSRYVSLISSLRLPDNLDVTVEVYSISKDLVGTEVDEVEYTTIDTSTIHHFAGVTILFRPRNDSEDIVTDEVIKD